MLFGIANSNIGPNLSACPCPLDNNPFKRPRHLCFSCLQAEPQTCHGAAERANTFTVGQSRNPQPNGKTKALGYGRTPQGLRSRLSGLKAVMAEYLAPTHVTGLGQAL
jgi:hypothetical protein